MVNEGVRIKDIADILGHSSIDTTAIYAKVDIAGLAEVALPFIGRCRMTGFKSAYEPQFADYVKLRRGLGLRFDVQAAILRDLVLVAHAHEGAITQTLALQFASELRKR